MLDVLIERAEAEETAGGFHKLNYMVVGTELAIKGLELAEIAADAAGLLESTRLTEGLVEHAGRARVMSGAGRLSMGVGVAGIITQYVSFWITLAGAHAEAKAAIAKDHVLRGLSYGVVLGANNAKPAYVRENFWLEARPAYPVYPEYEEAAQNLQNAALVSGYNQGKSLASEDVRRLFSDFHARMDDADRAYYTASWGEWSPKKKKDYYILCAALFRRDHLK